MLDHRSSDEMSRLLESLMRRSCSTLPGSIEANYHHHQLAMAASFAEMIH
jgi:hypothetical protein